MSSRIPLHVDVGAALFRILTLIPTYIRVPIENHKR
jgi:hypothetical protein